MSLINSSVHRTRIQHTPRDWEHGAIGAIHASLNHPFFDLLQDDPFCYQDRLSHRIQSTIHTINKAGKSRPCLVVSERKFRRLFLMGTIEGKSSLVIDKLTQEFLVPVAPTFSKGKFQLTVEPAGMEVPCWVVAIPSSLSFDRLLGYWRNGGPGDLTYRVPTSNLKVFLREARRKRFEFAKLSESDPAYKTDLIQQFLDQMEVVYGNIPQDDGSRCRPSSTRSPPRRRIRWDSRVSRRSSLKARLPVLQSLVDFPPL